MPLGIVCATTFRGVFAVNGKLPWVCNPDMKYFRNLTLNSNVVMGRKTAESLSEPLRDRKNFVITSKQFNKDGFIETTIKEMINLAKLEKVWVIGGANLIDHFFKKHYESIDIISHTLIDDKYLTEESNRYINEEDKILRYNIPETHMYQDKIKLGDGVDLKISYDLRQVSYIPKLDLDYLNLGRRILEAPIKVGRNGETRSCFDPDFFITKNFENGFPILRSKQVWWKGIKEELEFFWDGKTDTKELEAKGVKIWSGNTSEEFLNNNGMTHLKPGQMGPMYGYQWRYFNAPYEGDDVRHDSGSSEKAGVDQLEGVINLLVNDPNSRRILMTTYNPAQNHLGVLMPCHSIFSNFYVNEKNEINLKTYQRSADWFHGVPFNISSNALLLTKIVEEVNKRLGEKKYSPGNITVYFGDAHIYEVHVPVFTAQYVNSIVSDFPPCKITLDKNHNLVGYKPERKFAAPMVA